MGRTRLAAIDLTTGAPTAWNPAPDNLSQYNCCNRLNTQCEDLKTILVGIADVSAESRIVVILPNPVSTSFRVKVTGSSGNPDTSSTADLWGRNLTGLQLESGSEFKVDITEFPAGIYVLTVNSPAQPSILKIIKQ